MVVIACRQWYVLFPCTPSRFANVLPCPRSTFHAPFILENHRALHSVSAVRAVGLKGPLTVMTPSRPLLSPSSWLTLIYLLSSSPSLPCLRTFRKSLN